MNRPADALELLTDQHDAIEHLLEELITVPQEARAREFGKLADLLTTHLAVEQDLFYPSIAVPAKPEILAEHDQIKRLVADLLWRELDDSELPRLTDLTALVRRHITEQEALFMAVADAMPTGILRGMGAELRAQTESSLCITG